MPRDYLNQPPTAVRRADRAVEDDAWIGAFLRHAPVGTLATVHDGRPFVNMNLFVYDAAAHALFLHTAHVGRTRANVAASEAVCFCVHEMGRLLPADTALEFSVEYAGVTIFGQGRIVTDPEAARAALQLLMDKYAPHLRPGSDYHPITDEELRRTTVFRVDVDQWVGKRKRVAPDFPAAYRYGDHVPGFAGVWEALPAPSGSAASGA